MLERSESLGLKQETAKLCLDPRDYLDDIFRYAYARLGSRDDAEDVAMEVIQSLFRFRSEIGAKENPSFYLIGITRRKIADHLRKRTRQRGPNTANSLLQRSRESLIKASPNLLSAEESQGTKQ